MPDFCVHRSRRRSPERSWIALQIALVTTGVLFYFRVRGITDSSPRTAVDHAHDLAALEDAVGLDVERGLQAAASRWDPAVTLSNWVYIYGHWPVIAITMVWLALRHRVQFLRLRDGMMVSGAVGLAVFAWYPVAPPRLAAVGLTDTVTQRSHSYRVLQPPAFVNQYAAMPSLHAGWDLLVGVSIAGAAGYAWLRWLGRMLPVLMALAVVVTGNHFVVDVVAGIGLSLAGLLAARALEHRREPWTASDHRTESTRGGRLDGGTMDADTRQAGATGGGKAVDGLMNDSTPDGASSDDGRPASPRRPGAEGALR